MNLPPRRAWGTPDARGTRGLVHQNYLGRDREDRQFSLKCLQLVAGRRRVRRDGRSTGLGRCPGVAESGSPARIVTACWGVGYCALPCVGRASFIFAARRLRLM